MEKRAGARRIGAVIVLALAMLGIPIAEAATPERAELTRSRRTVRWTGAAPAPSLPNYPTYTSCAAGMSPTCDYFTLGTKLSNRARVAVTISHHRGDRYDVFVFHGSRLVASAQPHRPGRAHVVFETVPRATYRVAVRPWSRPDHPYRGQATAVGGSSGAKESATVDQQFDEVVACAEAVPDAAPAAIVEPHPVHVLVLVDGVSPRRAKSVFRTVATYYRDIGVPLRVSYGNIRLKGSDASDMIDQTKRRFGGIRPKPADVVYVMTAKDLVLDTSGNGVAGLADCIGGIRYAHRAFAIGEDYAARENREYFGFTMVRDATARIAAHEIGHLLGAHHHYANCVQGAAALLDADATPCTLMFNDLSLHSRVFSAATAAVIRSHTAYAAH